MAYVFYDTETTGLDKRFDHITQFAAVYTDENFTPKEHINLRCRIRPEIIPSIEALIKTNRTIGQLTDTTLPTNHEMMLAVKEKLEDWSPASFVGWNTIQFDEEFLRSGFYQNLLPPYLTSMPSNSRLDFFKLAHAVAALEPNSITIPVKSNGKRTFSLEAFAAANGFKNHIAHDALGDVYAVIHIARILKENSRLVWSLGNRFSNKRAAMDFIDECEPAIAIEPYYHETRHYPFIKVGNDPQIPAYAHVADLRYNFHGLENMNDDQKANWITSSAKPISRIRCNSSPIFIPLDEIDQFNDYDFDELYSAAEKLRSNVELRALLSDEYYAATHREYSNKYSEEQIYDAGFNEDIDIKGNFHNVCWSEREALLPRFQFQRSRSFALRLIAEHSRNSLSEFHTSAIESYIQARLQGLPNENVPWRTIERATEDLRNLPKPLGDLHWKSIAEYEQFLLCLQSGLS